MISYDIFIFNIPYDSTRFFSKKNQHETKCSRYWLSIRFVIDLWENLFLSS